MSGSIFLKTLRDMRGQILAWGLGLAALGAVNVLVFPSVVRMPGLVEFMENLPPAIKAFIGDLQALARPEGWLRAKLFDPLPLLLAVFGVAQGAQLIAGELEHRTIDLLLAQPVARWRVVLEKYLALACATVALCALLAAGLLLSSLLAGAPVSRVHLVLATFNALPLTWLFAALALLGSCVLLRARQAALLAGAVVVASFTLETLRLVAPALAGWRSVSLFAHHKASYSISGQIATGPILVLLGLGAALVLAAALAWERRDLA